MIGGLMGDPAGTPPGQAEVDGVRLREDGRHDLIVTRRAAGRKAYAYERAILREGSEPAITERRS
jgi:hypothetical protein